MEKYTCEPCNEKGLSNDSTSWCVICEKVMCKECTDIHQTREMSRTHKLVDILNRPKQLDVINKRCKKHGDLPFYYFCTDHDDLLCKKCREKSHSTCSKVLSLDAASKGIKQSQIFTDAVEQIQQILSSANSFTKERQGNIDNVSQDAEQVREAVVKFKQHLISRIDSFEINIFENLQTQKYRILSKLDDEVKQSIQIEESMSAQRDMFDLIEKYGTESQAFVLAFSSRSARFAMEEAFSKRVQESKSVHLNFKANDKLKLEDEEPLGFIDIKERPSDITFVPIKEQQSQTAVVRNEQLPFLSHDSEIELKREDNINISGMTCTESGLLLLSDSNSNRIFVYENNLYKYTMKLKYIPWDMTMIPGTTTAVVSSYEEPYIQLADIENRKVTNNLYLVRSIQAGVAASSKYIYVGVDDGITMMSHNCDILKTIDLKFKPWYICSSDNGRIYCTEYRALHGFNASGDEVFRYTSKDLKASFKCVNDNHGNIYVVGYNSNNVHRLRSDGSLIDIIMSEKDGVMQSFAICFNYNFTRFYVANNTSSKVFVFKVTDS